MAEDEYAGAEDEEQAGEDMIPLKDINPTRTTPIVNIALIAANVLVFLYMVYAGTVAPGTENAFIMAHGTVPLRVSLFLQGRGTAEGAFLPLLTSMFLHGGLMHLAGNMLFLWVFGDNVEDYFGHVGYLVFFLVCGVGSGLIHVSVQSRVEGAGGGGKRGDQRSDGCVRGAVSGTQDTDVLLHFSDSRAGDFNPGILVRDSVCRGSGRDRDASAGRRGVVGAYRGIFDWGGDYLGGEAQVVRSRVISDIGYQGSGDIRQNHPGWP